MPRNAQQTEVLALVDMQLDNAALPTYSALLDLVKRSAHLLAESSEANQPGVKVHRSKLVDAIKAADPAYYGQ